MIKKINVFTLDGCEICNDIKKSLFDLKIPFNEIKCEKSSDLCDELEAITKCIHYPMIQVLLTNNIYHILCKAKDYNDLQNNTSTVSYNIDNKSMLDSLLKLIKL